MKHATPEQVKTEMQGQRGTPAGPSAQQVQMVFVGTLLFVVLSVAAEYGLGEFAGLNIGQDFGVILGGSVAFGIAIGVVASMIRSFSPRSRGH